MGKRGSNSWARAGCRFGLVLLGVFPATGLWGSGETVSLNAVDIPVGATMTITFEVDVDDPLNICGPTLSNQGTVGGLNFPDLLTDDPDVAGASDPTESSIDLVELAVTKTNGSTTSVPGTATTYDIAVLYGIINRRIPVRRYWLCP